MSDLMFWGILASLLFTELTGLSPGGIVVPAYFALYWGDPARMGLTLGVALGAMAVVGLLSRYMILFGRRRHALYLLTGMVMKAALAYLYMNTALPNLSLSIGYLVPGLLAHDFEKQGILKTLVGLGIVLCVLRLIQALGMG